MPLRKGISQKQLEEQNAFATVLLGNDAQELLQFCH